MRALAQRSATAAKEIKGLIEASSDSVERGSQRVEQASATMGSVLESARNSAPLMGEIATASAEQSVGIEQINQAVTHLDSVTQQNASLVEEFAASAATLRPGRRPGPRRVGVQAVCSLLGEHWTTLMARCSRALSSRLALVMGGRSSSVIKPARPARA